MAGTSHRTLDICVVSVGDQFVATLESADGRRTQTTFHAPFEEMQLKYLVSEATSRRGPVRSQSGSPATAAAKEIGTALFEAIFDDESRKNLDAAIDAVAHDRSAALRIRVDVTGAPALAGIPWEALYYPKRNLFLALDPHMTLVRYVQTPEPAPRMQVSPPLRLLAMACSPEPMQPLDLAREKAQLNRSLQALIDAQMVEIEWLEENTLAAISRALSQREYHMFHFVGHGVFSADEGSPQGYLVLEDAQGKAELVSGERLGWILRRSVKIAVINACEGAVSGNGDPSVGVAANLLLQGIPAVIAMQFQISDDIAVQFSSDYYSGLAIGLPVDAAVTGARRNIMASHGNCAEWATPVLFLRAADGHIFDINAPIPQSGELADRQRKVVEETARAHNIEVDWSKIMDWVSGRTVNVFNDVLGGLPTWMENRIPSAAGGPIEELYSKALSHMEAEEWAEANRLFNTINNSKPGYRDISRHWRECQMQEQLAGIYKSLIANYARNRWEHAMADCHRIQQIAPDYKDVAWHAREIDAVLRPRPDSLPVMRPVTPPPPPPPRRPGATRPGSLPSAPGRKDKPPTLPG